MNKNNVGGRIQDTQNKILTTAVKIGKSDGKELISWLLSGVPVNNSRTAHARMSAVACATTQRTRAEQVSRDGLIIRGWRKRGSLFPIATLQFEFMVIYSEFAQSLSFTSFMTEIRVFLIRPPREKNIEKCLVNSEFCEEKIWHLMWSKEM